MPKAIFWDNDGVLVDTEHLYYRATREVLAEIGASLGEEQYVELFLRRNTGAWHLAEERGLSRAEIARLRAKRNALYGELLRAGGTVIAGVEEVLRALAPRYRMAVVTSSSREHFDLVHAASGLLRYFEFALTREDYERSKPDPEPYLRALARAGLAPGECLAIEDSERGLAAATAAGLECIVVPSRLTAGGDFRRAARVLAHIRELPAVLAERAAR
jgi:HAD superfamily hydrolase (TIGR01509 family)